MIILIWLVILFFLYFDNLATSVYFAIGLSVYYFFDYLGDFYEWLFSRFDFFKRSGIDLTMYEILFTVLYFALFILFSFFYGRVFF